MHLFTPERDIDVKSPQAPQIFRADRVVEVQSGWNILVTDRDKGSCGNRLVVAIGRPGV